MARAGGAVIRGHGSGARFLRGGDDGQRRAAVDVVERQFKSMQSSEIDDLACHFRRQRLPAFVVADVSLGAAYTVGHRFLSDTEAISDGLEMMHAPDSSAASSLCQYRRYFAI